MNLFEFNDDEDLASLPWSDPRHPFHVAHMEMALNEAAAAADEEEVPVGAVIVSLRRGVIGTGHNQREYGRRDGGIPNILVSQVTPPTHRRAKKQR